MIQLPSCVLSFLLILPFFECIHDKPYSLTSEAVVNASELPGPSRYGRLFLRTPAGT